MNRPYPLLPAILLLLGCPATPEPPSATSPPAGTFEGTTAGGERVVLWLVERDGTVQAHGELAGRRVVLAGPVAWSVTGLLTREDGRTVAVRLQQMGPVVTLTAPEEVIVLDRGEPGVAPAPAEPGAWAGRYQATSEGAVIAELDVSHTRGLLSGGGSLLGDAVALTAEVSNDGRARGSLVYADGSQIGFAATRDADGAISLVGLGAPLERVAR